MKSVMEKAMETFLHVVMIALVIAFIFAILTIGFTFGEKAGRLQGVKLGRAEIQRECPVAQQEQLLIFSAQHHDGKTVCHYADLNDWRKKTRKEAK